MIGQVFLLEDVIKLAFILVVFTLQNGIETMVKTHVFSNFPLY